LTTPEEAETDSEQVPRGGRPTGDESLKEEKGFFLVKGLIVQKDLTMHAKGISGRKKASFSSA